MTTFSIRGAIPREQKFTYRQPSNLLNQAGFIGYLRGDFGSSGNEFYTTWFDFNTLRKSPVFQQTFDDIINALRSDDYGLLKSRSSICDFARQYPRSAFNGAYCTEYAFRVDTKEHTVLVRCNPTQGDYNFSVYCFLREPFNEQLEAEA